VFGTLVNTGNARGFFAAARSQLRRSHSPSHHRANNGAADCAYWQRL